MNYIPLDEYVEILKVLPILCVDVIVCNRRSEYLLLKRANEPMKNRWWVLGGRVHKGETLEKAAIRKVKQEIGIRTRKMKPIGYYQLIKGANPFGFPFEYHSISVVFMTVIDGHKKIKLDKQNTAYKLSKKLPADFCFRPFE